MNLNPDFSNLITVGVEGFFILFIVSLIFDLLRELLYRQLDN